MLYDFYDVGHCLAFCDIAWLFAFHFFSSLAPANMMVFLFFPMCRIINVGYCINVLLQYMADFLSRLIQGILCLIFVVLCVI